MPLRDRSLRRSQYFQAAVGARTRLLARRLQSGTAGTVFCRMVTAAIICAAAGVVLLVVGLVLLTSGDEGPASEWRERTADTAADFRDWLRLGR